MGRGTRVAVLGTDHRNGAGVLHVCTETPSELLSCGYDTFVRLWDLRCPRKWYCEAAPQGASGLMLAAEIVGALKRL